MNTEIEAKFLNIDPASMRIKLAAAGYTNTRPRTLMTRTTLHRPDRDIRNIHEWWRVRDEGDKITMTYKHTVDNAAVDGTREIETTVGSYADTVALLKSTGLIVVAEQETWREWWEKDTIEIVIDEWPWIHPFIEIEGPSKASVETAAEALGFHMADAVFGGVGNIYQLELGFLPEAVNNLPRITFTTPLPIQAKNA